jgi:hypothetical protein
MNNFIPLQKVVFPMRDANFNYLATTKRCTYSPEPGGPITICPKNTILNAELRVFEKIVNPFHFG